MRNTTMSLILILTACTLRPASADLPATRPGVLSASASIDDILDALDARGQNLSDFTATVQLTETDASNGDSNASYGKVFFQRKSAEDGRLQIAFDKKVLGDRAQQIDHKYTLDNGWLIDRDYLAKKEVRQQVLRPGEKMDLLKLGEGPFPLPIGQNKEDVEKLFDVTKIDPAADDPAGTVHLRLTPKPSTDFAGKFKTIDVWVELTSAMPRRIQTLDTNETTVKTADLTDVKINVGLGDKDFAQPPLPQGWDTIQQPYQ